MSARKTPILLRRAPLSGRVNALYRYRRVEVNGREMIDCGSEGRWDVTVDFEELLLEWLMEDAPNLVAILDGAADAMELSNGERAELRAVRERIREACERHNERVDAEATGVSEHPGGLVAQHSEARANQEKRSGFGPLEGVGGL